MKLSALCHAGECHPSHPDSALGIYPDEKDSRVVDLFDSSTGMWSTAQLSVARSYLAATSVGNIAIFAGGFPAGGFASDVVDLFDITTGLWSTAQLSVARVFLASTSLGKVAIFAGGQSSGAYTRYIEAVQLTCLCLRLSSLYFLRVFFAAVSHDFLSLGRGRGFSNVVDLFDSATGAWSTAQLSVPRTFLSATSIGNTAMFAGGFEGK